MKSASAPKRARNDVVSGNVDRLADHGQFVRPDHRPRNSGTDQRRLLLRLSSRLFLFTVRSKR